MLGLSTTNDYHRKENSMQITVIRKSDNSVITVEVSETTLTLALAIRYTSFQKEIVSHEDIKKVCSWHTKEKFKWPLRYQN